MLIQALLLIEDRQVKRRLTELLKKMDALTDAIRSQDELLRRISRESSDLILISRSLVSADLMQQIHELPENPDVIVVSDYEDPEERARLLAEGCVAVLYQDLQTSSMQSVLSALVSRRRERAMARIDVGSANLNQAALSDFVSESETMRTFMTVVKRVATSNTTLLILGETGVGKERLAQAVHHESPRNSAPFVAVNCAALTESLLESELFGHEEGAFTGATRSRRGCLELAHKGTLFLDEIGEMPMHLQVKLLRVLQEREVQRVGGERPIPIDIRLMAATNRDLQDEVDAGRFRKDLYYRLSVVSLHIPPLRERREDIPSLVESYINFFRTQMAHNAVGISEPARAAMTRYDWPGNVRELINVVERAMLLCRDSEIQLTDLPVEICGAGETFSSSPNLLSVSTQESIERFLKSGWLEKPLEEVVEALERVYIDQKLRNCCGKVGETATQAGMDPRVLYMKMKRFGMSKEAYKIKRGA
jgi:two-component system response regulator AtoC